MTYLLDTHSFLWFVLENPRLSPTALGYIAAGENALLLSPASYWEIAIKVSLGKYSLPGPLQEFFEEQLTLNEIEILPISIAHAARLSTLPFHHRDPFDRMLVVQSLVESIPLISSDSILDAYAIERLW
jgi:PIN domain nuclease of toxin-antitoxin system